MPGLPVRVQLPAMPSADGLVMPPPFRASARACDGFSSDPPLAGSPENREDQRPGRPRSRLVGPVLEPLHHRPRGLPGRGRPICSTCVCRSLNQLSAFAGEADPVRVMGIARRGPQRIVASANASRRDSTDAIAAAADKSLRKFSRASDVASVIASIPASRARLPLPTRARMRAAPISGRQAALNLSPAVAQ